MTTRVIGVAIDIPEPYAAELSSWRRRTGDPLAGLVPPHVTLLPPTELSDDLLTAAEDHLRTVARGHRPFQMCLSGTGTFQPVSDVVFVVVSVGIAQCELLERDVRSGPLYRQVAFPYHPHVTVAHDVPPARLVDVYEGLGGYRATFPVPVLTMFERGSGGLWQRRRVFPLGDSATPGGCP